MSYQLLTKRSFDKEFARLPTDIQRRVAEAFLALRENPFPPGCVKLKGTASYRMRIGDYRVIYSPEQNDSFSGCRTSPGDLSLKR